MRITISKVFYGLCFFLAVGFLGQDLQAQKMQRADNTMAAATSSKLQSNERVSQNKPEAPKDDENKVVGEMYSVEMSPTSGKDQPEAIIHLYNRAKEEVAVLKFYSSSLGAQKSDFDQGTGRITVYYDLGMLPYFLDVLSSGQKLEIVQASRSGDVTVMTQMAAVRGGSAASRPATRGKMVSPTRTPLKQGK